MTAETLIADLRGRGVTLVPDGEYLRCRPKSALTPEDLEILKAHKAKVLATLRTEASPKLVCYACRERHFWRSIHGVVICGTCHPPASPDLVAEWLEASPGGAGR